MGRRNNKKGTFSSLTPPPPCSSSPSIPALKEGLLVVYENNWVHILNSSSVQKDTGCVWPLVADFRGFYHLKKPKFWLKVKQRKNLEIFGLLSEVVLIFPEGQNIGKFSYHLSLLILLQVTPSSSNLPLDRSEHFFFHSGHFFCSYLTLDISNLFWFPLNVRVKSLKEDHEELWIVLAPSLLLGTLFAKCLKTRKERWNIQFVLRVGQTKKISVPNRNRNHDLPYPSWTF